MLRFISHHKILLAAILLYVVILSLISSWRHYTFQTQVWDMAAFEQSFWNTLQGNFMYNNFEQANHFAIHFSPLLLALVPIYALLPGAYILFIIQSLALGLGAVPLYLLAQEKINARWAKIITLAYLLYPSLHWVNLFDFHAVPFAIPLVLSAFYFLEKNRYRWAAVFLLLTALVAENMIVLVFFIGVYVMIFKHRLFGGLTALGALGCFIAVATFIMPAFGGGVVRLDRYAQFGDGAWEIITTVVTNPALTATTIFTPEKIWYTVGLFFPVAFLPLVAWPTLILTLPGLLQNLLTTFKFQFTSFYQYDSILVAPIFIGVVYGVKKMLGSSLPKRILGAIFLMAVVTGFLLNSILSPKNFPLARFTDSRAADFRKLVASIPDDVSVATHTNLAPHLTHREHIYQMGFEPMLVDYVVGDGQDIFGFPDQATFDQYLQNYRQTGRYELLLIEDRYFIIKPKTL